MKAKKTHPGFAIALAWPQTYCKEPGVWYDTVTRWLGINKNNYYRAGHAALVLIERDGEKCHYFDFGRYHAPFQHGRVRSVETDHDLEMKTTPQIASDGKTILNFRAIINELQQNPACHGEGKLYASYGIIDFMASYNKALKMQKAGPIPYGPFIPNRGLNRAELNSTLPSPHWHPDIPEKAQWLSGEGAGSWFVFEFPGELLELTRYSPDGIIECNGTYEEVNGNIMVQEIPMRWIIQVIVMLSVYSKTKRN